MTPPTLYATLISHALDAVGDELRLTCVRMHPDIFARLLAEMPPDRVLRDGDRTHVQTFVGPIRVAADAKCAQDSMTVVSVPYRTAQMGLLGMGG